MASLQLRVHLLKAPPPLEDDALGEHLVGLVRDAAVRGAAPPVAVVVRPERTELLELGGLAGSGLSVPMLLAGLSRSAPEGVGAPVAIGVLGRFLYRAPGAPPGPGAPVALAFLEWPDCRWWHWRVALDASGGPRDDTELRLRAVDGDALPNGLGRWWSLGRRSGAVIRYGPPRPAAPPVAASPLVH